MRGQGKLITGVVVGAGTMYLLDPDRGARRRSLLRDQGVHAGRRIQRELAATARHVRNRTRGAAAGFRSRFQPDDAGDEVVEERVHTAIGRAVSHPAAIQVTVYEGKVTLGGHVLAHELVQLTRRVREVRGVSEVQNELEMHATAEGVTALQGGDNRALADLPSQDWQGTGRLVLGGAGGLFLIRGARKGGTQGAALGALGLGLLARAVTLSRHRSAQGVELETTLSIGAPLEPVWELWSNLENYSRFMRHLSVVRKIDEGHTRWVAESAAGTAVEWDAVITDWVPQQFIGWTSVDGSPLRTSGQVRLRRTGAEETEIDVRLVYAPSAGSSGRTVAALLGSDPAGALQEELGRAKALLEEAQAQRAKEEVRQEALAPRTRPRRTTGRRPKPKS
jgi:uncharacterized membrane protein